jgi:fucokinase / fucose-1-phosphate guanylyltransferase
MKPWDYLIVTAANEQQAKGYELQIRQRQEGGGIPQVRRWFVVTDLNGKRIGSGGSTLHCLHCVLKRERSGVEAASFEEAEAILSGLRILIVHAGGDSRRLPAYSHCGKMFVPIPAKSQPSVSSTLFDRLVPIFLELPGAQPGQVVVASGDALILFDAATVALGRPGITALGSFISVKDATNHGVFCANDNKDGSVRRYLQKPSPGQLADAGAVNEDGDSVLDLGVMSFDAGTAIQLMRAFFTPGSLEHGEPALVWKTPARDALDLGGIDLYREICCALGTQTTFEEYAKSLRACGSTLDRSLLEEWFGFLRQIPLNLHILPRCLFLHFGTTRQLITSGIALLTEDSGSPAQTAVILNSDIHGEIAGDHAWIEDCFVGTTLTLEGFSAVVGVDVEEPLKLRKGACLDVSAGLSRTGDNVCFVRCYGVDDTFKHTVEQGATFCGKPLRDWLRAIGADDSAIWSPEVPESERTLWNARVFPAVKEHQEYREWLWLWDVDSATAQQKSKYLQTDRYSSAEIAVRVDQSIFLARRSRIRSKQMAYDHRRQALDPTTSWSRKEQER